MENWIYATWPILGKVLISVVLIFLIIIFITRLSGLRTFAKMSSFDFATTIAIGSILASVVMNTDQPIVKGAIALGGIITFQSVFAMVVRKSESIRNLLTNEPMMLMYQGIILWENLDKTNVGENDLLAKLREANVIQMDQVLAVVLETTGDMSVLHSSQDIQLNKRLLKGVMGVPEEDAIENSDLVS